MSDLNRVQAGQKIRIPASTWNTVLDATEDFLRRRGDMGASAGLNSPSSSTIVPILNSSGADVERMNILGISAPAILPTENMDQFAHRVALVGVTPTDAGYKGKFAVTMEPIKNGEIGLACVSGACAVNLTVTADADKFADVNGTAAGLTSGDSGAAFILWKATGTGTVAAIVRLANLSGAGASLVPIKLSGGSGGNYTGIEQDLASGGDKEGASEVSCVNLAETTGGSSSNIDADAIVLATLIAGTCYFDHPTNAKYK